MSNVNSSWKANQVKASLGLPAQIIIVTLTLFCLVAVIVFWLFGLNNMNWKAKTESSAAETGLVAAAKKVTDSLGATQKVHLELEEIAATVAKENLELRKEIETLKKKLGRYDQVQKALDELKKDVE
jgi:Skp family chaperone for outer membrane proteins